MHPGIHGPLTPGSLYFIVLVEAFLHCNFFNKTAHCLEEKQSLLVNNECSYCKGMDQYIWPDRKTPLQSLVVNCTECYADGCYLDVLNRLGHLHAALTMCYVHVP